VFVANPLATIVMDEISTKAKNSLPPIPILRIQKNVGIPIYVRPIIFIIRLHNENSMPTMMPDFHCVSAYSEDKNVPSQALNSTLIGGVIY
jgi:hypothetical protein